MNTYTVTNRPTLLQEGDTVVFVVEGKTLSYVVKEKFLDNMRGSHNDQIFMDLGLKPYAFTRSAYGYDPQGGIWPQSNRGDYPALTRLVNALYHIIAEREPEQINPKAEPQPKVGDRVRLVNALFKVGDRVRVIPGYSPAEPLVGEGVIIEDDGTPRQYRVKLDSGERFWCGAHHIELIPVPPLTPEQHLNAYLSQFASDRYRSAVKALLDMLKTLA